MKRLLLLMSLSCVCISSFANQSLSAQEWLDRLSNSLKELNFNTSFVVVENNDAEPYRWLHGKDSDGTELEIISVLNGPRRDIARKGNMVSYIEPNKAPYSVESSVISGPIPTAFSGNVESLLDSYNFVLVGRSRILGRVAQVLRIVPRDPHRYAHWLWLDQETGLLLKLALTTKQGQTLEQIQFTHLEITQDIADALKQLKVANLPKVTASTKESESDKFDWHVNWLPTGFKQVRSSRHNLFGSNQTVDSILFSDGLVNVSVYVNPTNQPQRNVEYVHDGATVVLTMVKQNKEISVVGKIPSATAKAIADSLIYKVPQR